MIDIHRLNQQSYCILVLFLSGRFSTSMIAEQMRVNESAVKSACRAKGEGGLLPKRRAFMTRGERQKLLSHLKHYRMDEGMFDGWGVFTAAPISREPEEPVEFTDTKTKQGKRQFRELIQDAQIMRNAEHKERQELADGFAVRGVDAIPLEWLYREKLLRDMDETGAGFLPGEMHRYESGVRLRGYFEDSQIAGFSALDLSKVGRGSQGMSIPERSIVARVALEEIQKCMTDAEFQQITAIINRDEFVWDSISSSVGRGLVMEDIRRALDTVSVFIGLMSEKSFEERWKMKISMERGISRDEARERTSAARDLIQKGIRQ